MTLDDFFLSFHENLQISADTDCIPPEDAVTIDILEYIRDCGDVLDPQLCSFRIRGQKINAVDYDDDNETIDLFVTIAKDDSRIQKVSDSDVLSAFSKAEKFFQACRSGAIANKMEQPDDQIMDFVSIVQHTKSSVRNIRVFVLTNGLSSAFVVPPRKEEEGIMWDYQLWDIERVYQQYLIRAGKQKIEIDFLRDYNYRLKCLQMDSVSDKVDEYLAILPASILADVYARYKQGLLEKNVRTFLQFKAKVNNGIRQTIKNEPDMFFAYNNGISTTAEQVDITYENGTAYLNRIENLQIVNGGQTTASIYYTSCEKDIDLSKVFVAMKVSVVKDGHALDAIIPFISQYANSQTAIKSSDFSSNSPYHVSLERWSRFEWVPVSSGGKAVSKWYYERTRGQYLDERSRTATATEQKKFDQEYPKKQKFNKTDLAKYEMTWLQRPHDVSKGGEKNFVLFHKETDNNSEISRQQYQHLIAKAILFQETDKVVTSKKQGGYKANVVSYTVALLSYKTKQRLNLDAIWQHQGLDNELTAAIEKIVDVVWQHITNPVSPGMNVTEWCKKPECWQQLKDKFIDISGLNLQLTIGGVDGCENPVPVISGQELQMIEEAGAVRGDTWFSLARWAKENSCLSAFDRKLAYNLGVLYNRKIKLSPKQAKNALRILKEAKSQGCQIEEIV